jgi:hypothetical protein
MRLSRWLISDDDIARFFSIPYILKKTMYYQQPACNTTDNSYSSQCMSRTLYDGPADRAAVFGTDMMQEQALQRNYNTGYFYNPAPCVNPCAPRSVDICAASQAYYFDPVEPKQGANLALLTTQPNIYDDTVVVTEPTFSPPNLYKNWEPFSTTATPVLQGCYTKWVPHTPVEVAPRQDPNFWEADLNKRMYERGLITSAKENPYENFYRRQGLVQLLAINMPNTTDEYTKQITGPCQTFAQEVQRNGGVGPAVTNF